MATLGKYKSTDKLKQYIKYFTSILFLQKLAKLLSNFVESFRTTAQMVSIVGHSKMLPVVEHTGYADHLINPWLLDPTTLKFSLKGNLPYDQDLLKPQTELLRYVLEQPYSRDMVCSMLGLQKQVSMRIFKKKKNKKQNAQ